MTLEEIALANVEHLLADRLYRYAIDRCRLDGDCWMWQQSLTSAGRPMMSVGEKRTTVQQALFCRERGAYSARVYRLRNTCGSGGACCNPAHWRLVKAGEVIRQQYRTGNRPAKPMRYWLSLKAAMKRTDLPGSMDKAKEARALREQGWKRADLAKHFGVGESTITRWVSGKSYRERSVFA